MDAASLVLLVIGLLALIGAAAGTVGADTRDDFGRDGLAHHGAARDISPRFR